MANKRRKVRFEFYQINGKKTNETDVSEGLYEISSILKELNKKKMVDRDITLYGEKVRMDQADLICEAPNIYSVHFTRLRNDKPAYAELDKAILKEIPLDEGEYIAEDISCIYDTTLCVLMVQRNIHSLSVTGIEDYLNKFKEEEDTDISLQFVEDKKVLNKALKNTKFRKISLKSASANKDEKKSSLNRLIGPFMNMFDNFNGRNFTVEISAGNAKDDLSEKETKALIEQIGKNKSLFSSALVSAKTEDNVPVEKFDLINGKMYIYREYDLPEGSYLNSNSVIEDIGPFYYNKEDKKGFRKTVSKALNG